MPRSSWPIPLAKLGQKLERRDAVLQLTQFDFSQSRTRRGSEEKGNRSVSHQLQFGEYTPKGSKNEGRNCLGFSVAKDEDGKPLI